jgi:hypothetical protein
MLAQSLEVANLGLLQVAAAIAFPLLPKWKAKPLAGPRSLNVADGPSRPYFQSLAPRGGGMVKVSRAASASSQRRVS